MKNRWTITGFGCAALLATALAGAGPAHANPKGLGYDVIVTTNFGTTFEDCFTFSRNGTLTVGGYGPVAYTFQNRGDNQKKFQAVSSLATAESSTGFSIQFNGYALGRIPAGYLTANGSDEFGDSYTVQGPPSETCAPAAPVAGHSPYRNAAQ